MKQLFEIKNFRCLEVDDVSMLPEVNISEKGVLGFIPENIGLFLKQPLNDNGVPNFEIHHDREMAECIIELKQKNEQKTDLIKAYGKELDEYRNNEVDPSLLEVRICDLERENETLRKQLKFLAEIESSKVEPEELEQEDKAVVRGCAEEKGIEEIVARFRDNDAFVAEVIEKNFLMVARVVVGVLKKWGVK